MPHRSPWNIYSNRLGGWVGGSVGEGSAVTSGEKMNDVRKNKKTRVKMEAPCSFWFGYFFFLFFFFCLFFFWACFVCSLRLHSWSGHVEPKKCLPPCHACFRRKTSPSSNPIMMAWLSSSHLFEVMPFLTFFHTSMLITKERQKTRQNHHRITGRKIEHRQERILRILSKKFKTKNKKKR